MAFKVVEELKEKLLKASQKTPIDNAIVVDILKKLEAQTVTAEILQTTKVGKLVNQARKLDGADSEVQVLSKKMARFYKNILDNEATGERIGSGGSIRSISGSSAVSEKSRRDSSSSESSPASAAACREQLMKLYGADRKRFACAEVLMGAMCKGGSELSYKAAHDIETLLFTGEQDAAYKAKIKQLHLALKKNSELREKVLNKTISSEWLIQASDQDLKSTTAKAREEKLLQDFQNKKAMAFIEGAKTNDIPCPKCKERDVAYTQKQTRSADEPMTTFCTCCKCGYRWKFC